MAAAYTYMCKGSGPLFVKELVEVCDLGTFTEGDVVAVVEDLTAPEG